MQNEEKNVIEATIQVDTTELDEAIEKANRLKELLQEIHDLIHSLGAISRKAC